jgi:predicted phosphatase
MSVSEISAEIMRRVAALESNILNPDRVQYITDRERHRRDELLSLLKFIQEKSA